MVAASGSLRLAKVPYSSQDFEKIKQHRLLWKYHTNKAISSMAMSSSGQRIVIGCLDHYVYFFDKDRELLWDFDCLTPVHCVAMNDQGNFPGQEFLDYAKPLVEGEVDVPIEDGLPVFMRFEKKWLPVKCAQYQVK